MDVSLFVRCFMTKITRPLIKQPAPTQSRQQTNTNQASNGPIAQQLQKVQANGQHSPTPKPTQPPPAPAAPQRGKRSIVIRMFFFLVFLGISIFFLINAVITWRDQVAGYIPFTPLILSLF